MNSTIIACQVLRDELNLAIRETGCSYPVIWVDAGYHNDPDLLRTKLQVEIDALENVNNILFAYGCCGNGLVGLKASTANLIIPKTDDCISMVLSQPGGKFERHKHTYFVTKGWLENPKNIFKEYQHAVARYGEQRAKRLFDKMLKHYRYLMLVDTKAYDLAEWASKAAEFADNLNLEMTVAEGGIMFLKKLLTGPHDQDFCVIQKGGVVKISHFSNISSDSFQ